MSFWYYCLDKIPMKLFLDFCPEIYCSFLGAYWKLFGAFCRLPYLWYYLLNTQEAGSPKSLQDPPLPGSYKKFQGRNSEIISLVFWMKLLFHKDILKLTDLYPPPLLNVICEQPLIKHFLWSLSLFISRFARFCSCLWR